MTLTRFTALAVAAGLSLPPTRLTAQQTPQDAGAPNLAKDLLNPVAHLVSVPFESNLDFDQGSAHATSYTGNLKPVIPFPLSKSWNLITRTIVPFISTESPDIGGRRASGVGDITTTVYLSPEKASAGWFWGVGPGLIFPSATSRSIGSGKWSAGPSAGVLWQKGGWTFMLLTGHAWSFAGDPTRPRVSTTFLQPSVSFTTPKDTSFGVDTTSSYDWTEGQWTVPVELSAAQLVKIGKRPLNIGLTGRYGVRHPAEGPRWGLVFTVTLLFPK